MFTRLISPYKSAKVDKLEMKFRLDESEMAAITPQISRFPLDFMPCQQRHHLWKPGPLCQFTRRFVVIDSRSQVWVGSCFEQQFQRWKISFAHRHVQRCVVVDAALIRVSAKFQEQFYDLEHILAGGRARLRTTAR